ncbi:MAG TPA: DnaB-like helicase C-terminal domain-containing protein, partial [Modicisalibacter sp.]|nr:DnaB-like helicase C-terminal domain-containing protein [Modicisalibacter sp.]
MNQFYDPAMYENPLLGAALVDSDIALSLLESVTPDDFVIPDHRAIWGAVIKTSRSPETMNIVDVSEQSGVAINYLAELVRNSYSTDAKVVNNWRDAIKKKSRLHRMQANFQSLIEQSQQSGADVDDIARQAAGYVIGLENQSDTQQKRTRKDVLRDRIRAFSDRYDGIADPVGLRTGIGGLDQLIYGLKPSELILLAARPAMGKTALAMQIARLTACNAKKPVAMFSLEMDLDELYDRWLVQQSGINAGSFQHAKGVEPHIIDNIGAAAQILTDAPIEAFDNIFDIEGIVAKAEALRRRHGELGLIVVDYLQLIGSKSTRPMNRAQEVGEYSRALKLLAMRMQCPVLAL